MKVVGISGFHNSVAFKRKALPHLADRDYRIVQGLDSAAVLVTDDGVVAAAAEERFCREKGTGAFPYQAIRYCLQAGGIVASEIDYIAHGFSYEPFRPLFENHESEFIKKQFSDVYSRDAQLRLLQDYLPGLDWSTKFFPVPHHVAHAASTFYLSGFEESLILIVDGMGELDSTTIAVGNADGIRVCRRIRALHSLGILYAVFTLYLGFDINTDEYKVMGLAPYGSRSRYFDQIMDFIKLQKDGTYTIPILFQNQNLEEKETYKGTLRLIADQFGPPRIDSEEITQRHMDIAAGLQEVLQASLLHMLRHFKNETGQRNLCMAGGVALNCTANGVIRHSRLFDNMFIQPAAGDDGSALGAALYVQRMHGAQAPLKRMTVPLWGPAFDDIEIEHALRQQDEYESAHFESFDALARVTAERIYQGEIIAWFQGRMEFGPRALGNRSILADPRDFKMRDRINALVKKREAFRPFAPAVSAEAAPEFFEMRLNETSLFSNMIVVTQVREGYRRRLPAITHVDGSARVQTVAQDDNFRFWRLLVEFGNLSGMPILLNTSFNVRGQPIVCSPEDAVSTFLFANLDALVIGNFLVVRRSGQRSADADHPA